MYRDKASDAKYDWEKEEEKGGEKWYEKPKGNNTQCAKASELSTSLTVQLPRFSHSWHKKKIVSSLPAPTQQEERP